MVTQIKQILFAHAKDAQGRLLQPRVEKQAVTVPVANQDANQDRVGW
ncbi:hypothetical protein GCM10022631_13200 [Deinococcus rubellus]